MARMAGRPPPVWCRGTRPRHRRRRAGKPGRQSAARHLAPETCPPGPASGAPGSARCAAAARAAAPESRRWGAGVASSGMLRFRARCAWPDDRRALDNARAGRRLFRPEPPTAQFRELPGDLPAQAAADDLTPFVTRQAGDALHDSLQRVRGGQGRQPAVPRGKGPGHRAMAGAPRPPGERRAGVTAGRGPRCTTAPRRCRSGCRSNRPRTCPASASPPGRPR